MMRRIRAKTMRTRAAMTERPWPHPIYSKRCGICSSIGGIGSRGYNAQQLDGGVRECTVPQDSHEYPLAENEMKRMDSRCDPRQHNMTATAGVALNDLPSKTLGSQMDGHDK